MLLGQISKNPVIGKWTDRKGSKALCCNNLPCVKYRLSFSHDFHQRMGRGGWGGCSPPSRGKNSIIRAKLIYRSAKETVKNILLFNINLLLTEREGRTGEYWPEVVTVQIERSEVRTKTTEGQYSRVRPEQARLVSSLLYGTLDLFLIVKCTSGGLHLKNVRLLHPSLKFRKKFNLFSFCW